MVTKEGFGSHAQSQCGRMKHNINIQNRRTEFSITMSPRAPVLNQHTREHNGECMYLLTRLGLNILGGGLNIVGCLSLRASCMYRILSWISSRIFFTQLCLVSRLFAWKTQPSIKICCECLPDRKGDFVLNTDEVNAASISQSQCVHRSS